MAWRFNFRKTFSKGPFRWTWSKSGFSTSVGRPGLRYSMSAKGKKRVTVGIPGTGIYWTNNLDEKPESSAPKKVTKQRSISSSKTKKTTTKIKSAKSKPQVQNSSSGQEQSWWLQPGIGE